MKLTRYIKREQIKLELKTKNLVEVPQSWSRERYVWYIKAKVLEEIVDLFDKSGKVVNRSKLYTDLYNRERKATTGIGEGVAIPHVRTMQAKDLVVVFARSREGVEFGAIDGMPVNLFFGVVAPPYNDRVYLEVYRQLGLILRMVGVREALLSAPDEDHIIKIIGDFL